MVGVGAGSFGQDMSCTSAGCSVSLGTQLRLGGQGQGLALDGVAEPLLQLDEARDPGKGGQRLGEAEDLADRLVAGEGVAAERRRLVPLAAQVLMDGPGQQLGVAEGVGDPVAGDRIAVIARITDQGPPRAVRLADDVRQVDRAPDRGGPSRPAQPGAELRRRRGDRRGQRRRPIRARGQQRSALRGRAGDPHARLVVVGSEDSGHRPRRQMELETAIVQAVDVAVERAARRGRFTQAAGTDLTSQPGPYAVGDDHQVRGQPSLPVGRVRGRDAGHPAVGGADQAAHGRLQVRLGTGPFGGVERAARPARAVAVPAGHRRRRSS